MPAIRALSRSLQAFFQEPYLEEHPEDQGNIERLKDLIAWQVLPTASPCSPVGCPVTPAAHVEPRQPLPPLL